MAALLFPNRRRQLKRIQRKGYLIIDGDKESCKQIKYALQTYGIEAYYTQSVVHGVETARPFTGPLLAPLTESAVLFLRRTALFCSIRARLPDKQRRRKKGQHIAMCETANRTFDEMEQF